MIYELFLVITIAIIFFISLKVIISILPFFLKEQNLQSKYGNGYAVITGGTDGIGLKIAKKLISQGLNVYIIGLKTDLITQNDLPEGSFLVENDLADPQFVQKVCEWISQNHPTLLVHGAGLCIPQSFSSIEHPSKYIDAYISSLVEMTSSFIKARNKNGGIVFFSSQVAFFSSPFATLYAATKSFTGQFADSLSSEYPNLDILCLFPGAVNNTSFFRHFPKHWYFNFIRLIGQSPDTIASLVFRSIGRIRLVDSGILSYGTRIATSFIDQNIINYSGQIVVSSLRNQMEGGIKHNLPL